MVASLKPIHAQILGATLIELLHGELSDEIIAAVDSIKRDEVPEPLNDLVGWMHGMTTHPPLRDTCITSLIMEIRGIATEVLEKRIGHPTPLSGTWVKMYNVLQEVLGYDADTDLETTVQGMSNDMLPDIDKAPTWAEPLILRARDSHLEGSELTLELLDVLEGVIQKRKAELMKPTKQL